MVSVSTNWDLRTNESLTYGMSFNIFGTILDLTLNLRQCVPKDVKRYNDWAFSISEERVKVSQAVKTPTPYLSLIP